MRKVLIGFFCLLAVTARASVKDSVGIKEKEGRKYILHKIEPKETLFSLSQRYGVEIEKIITTNPDVADNLPVEAIIEIPVPVATKVAVDKSRIIHTVQPSETLYSISKLHQVDVQQIKKWNDLADNSISIGQELVIYPEIASNQVVQNEEKNTSNDGVTMRHHVKAGETLYSLSRQYNVSRQDIRKWNNLTDDNIKLGQDLIVGYIRKSNKPVVLTKSDPENTRFTQSTQPDDSVLVNADTKILDESGTEDKNNKPAEEGLVSTKPVITEPEINKIAIEDNPYNKSNLSLKNRKATEVKKPTVETGVATLIEGSEDTKKYLALHKSLPVGTIMEVKNEMNNLSVFVKVIGKLPSTGENKGIDLKITKEAYDRLGAIDEKFRVQMSYIPR